MFEFTKVCIPEPSNTRGTRAASLRAPLALFIAVLMAVQVAWGQAQEERQRSYDRRSSMRTITSQPAAARSAQLDALARLRRDLGGSLTHRLNPTTGITSNLSNPVGYLTGPRPDDPSDIALDFIRSNAELLGLEPADLGELEVTDTVYSAPTGATHVYLRQVHRGLPVYNATLQIHVNRDGRISGVHNGFVPVAGSLKSPLPVINAANAVSAAAGHLEVRIRRLPLVAGEPVGVRQRTSLSAPDVSSRTIQAELMWLPVGRDLKLVWRFQVHTLDHQHIYDITVDAEPGLAANDGSRVYTRFDWVSSDSYRVYQQPVESPQHTSPAPPADSRTLAVGPADFTASPLGWHDTGSVSYTIMRGNNTHAYQDTDANNQPPASEPSCGSSLNCDFPIDLSGPPSGYQNAAIANLFYWNNVIHDVQYQYGFDEAGGNFQVNNFGNGGQGNDDVRAEAQDGSGDCNANFATPTDGGRPRMQMFLCSNTTPARDGDLDNGVIVHEYGHGISIRQVGGPGNSSCLGNAQQGGEGWSDWFALVYTAESGDQGTDARGTGTYLFGQAPDGPGIRPQPYSTDPLVNNYTYESINGLAIPHGVGSVWAQVLWEVYWRLVADHGFNPDLYGASLGAGNHRALLYVNEGLKNTACSPTFVDARDGVIQAAVDNFGGEDVCALWEVFAAFGLGTDAVSGGSNSTNPTNGFSLPASCQVPPDPPTCPAGTIDFNAFTLEAYSNQDGTGTVSVENNGDTLLMEGNRWRRSAQSFAVTADTVIEFQFQSTAQGEILGIGFDEDQELTNDLRIFQFWGTQNWTGAHQFSPRYSGSGDFESFSIPVGQFYGGGSMRLVFVNDKDAGSPTNLGRFGCVRVVGAPPPPPPPTGSFEAHFDNDAEGFTYIDDAFRGASQPAYASGAYLATGGFAGGGLSVDLGGIDDADINNMSGGWQRAFNLAGDQQVTISFRYNLTQAANYESNELSQALLSVDGNLIGVGANDYLAQIAGDGNGGAAQSTGWVLEQFDLGVLAAGSHNVTIGGFNNLKTFNDESTQVLIDDVILTATSPGNRAPTVTIDAPADGSQFVEGTNISFSGTASDPEEGDVTASLNWTSTLDGMIGSGGSFSQVLSVGSHTVTASVTDSGGLSGSDSISVTIDPDTGGCTDCIDWNATQTVSYSNQDSTGTVEGQEGGASLFMEGNRWRRTTQGFNVTPFTVIEFEFMSTSQGEIHGIGFDEDDTLTNNTRIFEIFGTQIWGGAFQNAQKYTTGDLGNFVSFRINVGQFYTGNNMFLVLVNDKDSGTLDNNSTFRHVRVFEEPPPACGAILHATDFEAGANGWSHSAPDSTCSTGNWVVGDPDSVVNGGVTTQLEDDHTSVGVNAFFTQPNAGGAGTDDVDGGVCTALSPVIDATAEASVQITLWYYHGQRDQGDDASGDFFSIDVSTDGGATYTTNLVSIGDVTSNAVWTLITATIANPGMLTLRVQASDGAGPGDLVEAGLDDIVICVPPTSER